MWAQSRSKDLTALTTVCLGLLSSALQNKNREPSGYGFCAHLCLGLLLLREVKYGRSRVAVVCLSEEVLLRKGAHCCCSSLHDSLSAVMSSLHIPIIHGGDKGLCVFMDATSV